MDSLSQIQVRDVDEDNGVAVIEVEGDLDYSIYSGFKKTINSLVKRGVLKITYDLSKLAYIQSLGLGIIMWSYVELNSRGGEIIIEGANDKIKKLFQAAQLDTLVTIRD